MLPFDTLQPLAAGLAPLRLTLVLALAGLTPWVAGAQEARGTDKVLREDQVTVDALVKALAPPGAASAPPEASSGVRKRGFKPAAAPTTAAAPTPRPPPEAAGRASMLITFVADSAELQPSARATLDVVARALQSDQLAAASFSVEGHADPRGGDEHNLDLSRRRADSVVGYLVRERGIAAARLSAVGKGSSELLNPSVPTAPENRRVTIVVQSGR